LCNDYQKEISNRQLSWGFVGRRTVGLECQDAMAAKEAWLFGYGQDIHVSGVSGSHYIWNYI